jgi:long-chain acyl-CoA synthetase
MQLPHAVITERPTPLAALLVRATRTPDAIALIADGQRWSCARLAAESARLAGTFHAVGVRAGDRVALHMFNRIELVLAYLACWRMGAIAVPLNTRYKATELAAMLDRIEPVLYLGEVGLYAGIRDVSEEMLAPERRFIVGLHVDGNGGRPWSVLLDMAVELAPPAAAPASVDRNAPAALLSTSGTTGQNKLAVWTPEILASLALSATERGVGAADIALVSTPMMHGSGLFFLSSCLLTGATAVLLERFEPEAALDAIAVHRCTTFFGLPLMCAELADSQRRRARDLTSLRLCLCGGDVCPPATELAFQTVIGQPLLSCWLATEEVTAMIPAPHPGPLTRPLPGAEVRLVDETGAAIADGEAGEMLIRSTGTTPGYWVGPGRIDRLPDGWFHTGDLLRYEPDNDLRYMGRTKDLIVRAGSNISPVEVETVLRRQSGVVDAAVAGLPDPRLGQRVGAVLVLAEGLGEAAVPGVLAGVRQELADYKVPEQVAIVAAIPRNTLTKVDRRAVAAAAGQAVAAE